MVGWEEMKGGSKLGMELTRCILVGGRHRDGLLRLMVVETDHNNTDERMQT